MSVDPMLGSCSLAALRRRRSMKWRRYAGDVLPAWVAEMDFDLAQGVKAAVREAIEVGDCGYPHPGDLGAAYAGFAWRRFGWAVDPRRVFAVPDVMTGIAEVLQAVTPYGSGVVINPPVYPPFFDRLTMTGRRVVTAPLRRDDAGGYHLDVAAVDAALAGDGVAAYLLCSPHNPTGRVWSRDDLTAVAEICARRGVALLVDEIHAPLALPGARHVPFLSLEAARELAGRTFTFTSASKGWNIPGLKCAVAVVDHQRPARVLAQRWDALLASHLGVLATAAAFRDGEPWLDAVLAQLDENRGLLTALLDKQLPAIGYVPPQASFLAWLDCRVLHTADPASAFLDRGRVAVSSGADFGAEGAGFVRVNIGTSPELLAEIVRRMSVAVGVRPSGTVASGGATQLLGSNMSGGGLFPGPVTSSVTQRRRTVPRTARDVVFVDGVRTPFGKAGRSGLYAQTRADDMVIRVIRELLRRNPNLPPERVGDVAIAATTQIGDQGLTIGRSAAVLAGLPRSVPGFAIDRMCAGAMTAVTTVAGSISFGAYDLAIAGGVEHMGRHPMGEAVDPNPRFVAEKLVDTSALVMGATAENLHDRFPQLTRQRADAYAAASQRKVAAAYAAGKIQPHLVPTAVRNVEQGYGLATADEPPRPDTTVTALADLKTPFRPHGNVTAGNSAGLNDGATGCVIAAEDVAADLGLSTRMRLVDFSFAGVEPEVMGVGPIPATETVLARNSLTIDDVGLIEINEAFAVQVLAFCDHFKLADDDERVNPWGGAIALGHPLASSGVRLMIQLAAQFAEHPEIRYGLTTMCVGMGMGGTVLWENPNHQTKGGAR